MSVQTYKKKPVLIQAIQVPKKGEAKSEQFLVFMLEAKQPIFCNQDGTVEIETLEGKMTANPLDYIIKGVKGEFYPCKPDIFELTYEKAE